MKRLFLIDIFFIGLSSQSFAQFGVGFTLSNDIYARYHNPEDPVAYESAGSFLLNLGLGPKIWVGGESFSVSVEGQATISPLGLALKDYKGLGMASFPFIARLNFNGLSGLNKEGLLGFSVGGGLQWNRTELFGVTNKYEELGVVREYQKVYVGVLGYGFGISGFTAQAIIKYGYHPDTKANTFHIGLQYDFNIPMLKKISDPASEL